MSRPDDDDGGFLGRWAKRKQAVQLEAQQDPNKAIEAPKSLTVTDGKTVPETPHGEVEPEQQLPMPSLDDVLPGGDVSMFLQKHVPDSLRNLALRKAWASDPEISTFIEIAENQWDFNNPDSIPGFSSRLEGVDIKAMVEKLFNNVAPPEQDELKKVPIDTLLGENAPHEEQTESAEDRAKDVSLAEKTAELPLNHQEFHKPRNDGVEEERTVKSAVYESIKKRHGSALPS